MEITCFKAYDIRGRLPDQLNEDVAWRIGRAYAEFLKPKIVVVGRDVRLSSESLTNALAEGLCQGGVDVLDIGLCGTEEIYHATFSQKTDGGIMVTASHNPIDYNGMKLVREESKPISGDTGLNDIRALAEKGQFQPVDSPGAVTKVSFKAQYVEHLLSYLDPAAVKPFKVVFNAGNGCAGPIVDLLEKHLPLEVVKICHQPDGSFPNGIPNPLLRENRSITRDAVLANNADLGIAWDGDFDRCFFFDEKGEFIEGYYIVGLLSEALLSRHPGEKIIHDPRLTWNTIDTVKNAGGIPVQSKTGHAFIKERMRKENAVYGGEMSAHHYFREFAYCDSGMIPWLMVVALMSSSGKSMSELVADCVAKFPASGEINRRVADASVVIADIKERYQADALDIDFTDGLSLDMGQWRLNLRESNTEPVLRLNVESRGDMSLMEEKTAELLKLIGGEPA
ncbi:phosphomannomutase [Malonomonas rubra DSM 5091]|uniref:Phosphomannomutase n=1 Tax=Malonomonas rubra DSM 5091 TaxID=1122189 RepID=A0A1M6KAX2_MALRU|nr:phosphomannomutase [Malonomonas rubra]SHJ56062.1 phosphomannomutase [Malonomonas rubra DSM 5091]